MNQIQQDQELEKNNKGNHTVRPKTPLLKRNRTLRSSTYRNHTQIMYDVLMPLSKAESIKDIFHGGIVIEGLTKTQLMYKAGLSYSQLKVYASQMEGYELIIFNYKTQRYTIGPKGHRFMQLYDELSEIVPDIKSRYFY